MAPRPISKPRDSGLELVPKTKSKKTATIRDYAKVEFKPWVLDPDPAQFFPPSCGVAARMAYAFMGLSRDDLIAMAADTSAEDLDALMYQLSDTAERLKAVAQMLEQAHLRMLVAMCAHEQATKRKRVPKVGRDRR